MMGDVIRHRRPDDIPACAAALVTIHESDGYPVEGVAAPEAWLTPPGQRWSWVAETEHGIVGHVAVSDPQPDDDAARLYAEQNGSAPVTLAVLGRLFVLPSARGRSLGSRLVRAVVNHANEHGLQLVLDVMLKDDAAIRLYEHLGWRHLGDVDHDDGHGHTVRAACYAAPSRVMPRTTSE